MVIAAAVLQKISATVIFVMSIPQCCHHMSLCSNSVKLNVAKIFIVLRCMLQLCSGMLALRKTLSTCRRSLVLVLQHLNNPSYIQVA